MKGQFIFYSGLNRGLTPPPKTMLKVGMLKCLTCAYINVTPSTLAIFILILLKVNVIIICINLYTNKQNCSKPTHKQVYIYMYGPQFGIWLLNKQVYIYMYGPQFGIGLLINHSPEFLNSEKIKFARV